MKAHEWISFETFPWVFLEDFSSFFFNIVVVLIQRGNLVFVSLSCQTVENVILLLIITHIFKQMKIIAVCTQLKQSRKKQA